MINREKSIPVLTWLAFYVCTCLAAAGAIWFGGDLNANGWVSPSFAPPPWVFGPVWTTLYLLIATSGYLISKSHHNLTGLAIALWCVQMTANAIWTPVFFGAFDLRGSLFIIGVLWLSITVYIPIALKATKLAGYLFIPYWFWVSFAAFLNFSYLQLNAEA
mgnify:FL=1